MFPSLIKLIFLIVLHFPLISSHYQGRSSQASLTSSALAGDHLKRDPDDMKVETQTEYSADYMTLNKTVYSSYLPAISVVAKRAIKIKQDNLLDVGSAQDRGNVNSYAVAIYSAVAVLSVFILTIVIVLITKVT